MLLTNYKCLHHSVEVLVLTVIPAIKGSEALHKKEELNATVK